MDPIYGKQMILGCERRSSCQNWHPQASTAALPGTEQISAWWSAAITLHKEPPLTSCAHRKQFQLKVMTNFPRVSDRQRQLSLNGVPAAGRAGRHISGLSTKPRLPHIKSRTWHLCTSCLPPFPPPTHTHTAEYLNAQTGQACNY